MNLVILHGGLGQDPRISYTQSGKPWLRFSVATDNYFKDADGETQKATDWHNVVVWGATAESLSQRLTKGSRVLIEGRLGINKWKDKDGNDKETAQITAYKVEVTGGKQPPQAQAQPRDTAPDDLGPAFPSEAGGMDDVPF